MKRGNNTYYYHANHLGSVMALTDSEGHIAEHIEYDAFGTPSFFDASGNALSASAIGNNILFTGREWDAESHTYYFRARTQHPALGRFMQKDPMGYIDGMNDYVYVGNKVSLFIDRYGFLAESCEGKDNCPNCSFWDRLRDELLGMLADNPLSNAIVDHYNRNKDLYDDLSSVSSGALGIVGGIEMLGTSPYSAGLAGNTIAMGADDFLAGVINLGKRLGGDNNRYEDTPISSALQLIWGYSASEANKIVNDAKSVVENAEVLHNAWKYTKGGWNAIKDAWKYTSGQTGERVVSEMWRRARPIDHGPRFSPKDILRQNRMRKVKFNTYR